MANIEVSEKLAKNLAAVRSLINEQQPAGLGALSLKTDSETIAFLVADYTNRKGVSLAELAARADEEESI